MTRTTLKCTVASAALMLAPLTAMAQDANSEQTQDGTATITESVTVPVEGEVTIEVEVTDVEVGTDVAGEASETASSGSTSQSGDEMTGDDAQMAEGDQADGEMSNETDGQMAEGNSGDGEMAGESDGQMAEGGNADGEMSSETDDQMAADAVAIDTPEDTAPVGESASNEGTDGVDLGPLEQEAETGTEAAMADQPEGIRGTETNQSTMTGQGGEALSPATETDDDAEIRSADGSGEAPMSDTEADAVEPLTDDVAEQVNESGAEAAPTMDAVNEAQGEQDIAGMENESETGNIGADYSRFADMTVGDILNMPVETPDARRVGEIDYLMHRGDGGIDAVIGIGGFLGLGEYTVALPLESFQTVVGGGRLYVSQTEDELKAMPEFDESGVSGLDDDVRISSLASSG